MPYVFGTLDMLQRPWTDIDKKLSDTMQSCGRGRRRDAPCD